MTQESVAQIARLRSLLESIEDPAWLVHPEGKVLAKNQAAELEGSSPSWVLDQVAGRSAELPAGARVRRIQVDGRPRVLVFGRPSPDSARAELERLGLDDLHAETAEHLIRGFSDLEIALLLDRPIGSVHALIVQVHRLLGVRTRVELVDFVRRQRRPSIRPAADRGRTTIEARPSAIIALGVTEERRLRSR